MTEKPVTACLDTVIHEDAVLTAGAALVDGPTATQLAQIFASLSDPTRIRLISALNVCELCVCDLATVLGMTQSAVSHQLRVLRNLNLVRYRKEGRVVYYTLEDEHVRQLFERGLEHIRHAESV